MQIFKYERKSQCLRRVDDTGINIGYAIVYQCLKTICTIYPNPHLIELASNTISIDFYLLIVLI